MTAKKLIKKSMILLLSLFIIWAVAVPVVSVQAESSPSESSITGNGSDDGNNEFVAIETKMPTDTENGYILYRCESSGLEYKETLYATGHVWSAWSVVKAPTCTEPGQEERTCNVGSTHSETRPIPALGHEYVLTVTLPTDTEAGVKTYTCSRCGDTYTEPGAPALGHEYAATVAKEPTCTGLGVITYTCSRCGDSYTEPIPALGHEYGDWVTDKPAGPGVAGSRYKECARCGERMYEAIAALPIAKKPVFDVTDAVIAGANVAALCLFGFLLFGEIMLLLWKRKKKKQILEQKQLEESGKDGYEYI
ncbi:MAG: hypothetical protein LBI03_10815 [Clostridiales bacterium]|nr:hypothetical protein [Clostridiales bacterium]